MIMQVMALLAKMFVREGVFIGVIVAMFIYGWVYIAGRECRSDPLFLLIDIVFSVFIGCMIVFISVVKHCNAIRIIARDKPLDFSIVQRRMMILNAAPGDILGRCACAVQTLPIPCMEMNTIGNYVFAQTKESLKRLKNAARIEVEVAPIDAIHTQVVITCQPSDKRVVLDDGQNYHNAELLVAYIEGR